MKKTWRVVDNRALETAELATQELSLGPLHNGWEGRALEGVQLSHVRESNVCLGLQERHPRLQEFAPSDQHKRAFLWTVSGCNEQP